MKDALNKIKNKQITVGIIGLGYVGLPLAMRFSDEGVLKLLVLILMKK